MLVTDVRGSKSFETQAFSLELMMMMMFETNLFEQNFAHLSVPYLGTLTFSCPGTVGSTCVSCLRFLRHRELTHMYRSFLPYPQRREMDDSKLPCLLGSFLTVLQVYGTLRQG